VQNNSKNDIPTILKFSIFFKMLSSECTNVVFLGVKIRGQQKIKKITYSVSWNSAENYGKGPRKFTMNFEVIIRLNIFCFLISLPPNGSFTCQSEISWNALVGRILEQKQNSPKNGHFWTFGRPILDPKMPQNTPRNSGFRRNMPENGVKLLEFVSIFIQTSL